jgi:hypothetical protein
MYLMQSKIWLRRFVGRISRIPSDFQLTVHWMRNKRKSRKIKGARTYWVQKLTFFFSHFQLFQMVSDV